MQISCVVPGRPCEGILELGDEIVFIGNESLEGMTLQDVKTVLSWNQEDEITFIVKRGVALECCTLHCDTIDYELQREGATSHQRLSGEEEIFVLE